MVDDAAITKLNHQYFGRNRPTNVIAFPMTGEGESLPSLRLLGDIVISTATAKRQAWQAGGRAEDEIFFLLIHGILHLLGYDHEGSHEERIHMENKERELFQLIKNGVRRKA